MYEQVAWEVINLVRENTKFRTFWENGSTEILIHVPFSLIEQEEDMTQMAIQKLSKLLKIPAKKFQRINLEDFKSNLEDGKGLEQTYVQEGVKVNLMGIETLKTRWVATYLNGDEIFFWAKSFSNTPTERAKQGMFYGLSKNNPLIPQNPNSIEREGSEVKRVKAHIEGELGDELEIQPTSWFDF